MHEESEKLRKAAAELGVTFKPERPMAPAEIEELARDLGRGWIERARLAPRVSIEDVLPDHGSFGFLARWEVADAVARVRMWEWVAKESNGTRLLRKRSDDFDVTTNAEEAELYLSGSIKWDGCSSFDFHHDDTEKHLCGLSAYQDFCAVLRYVWTRAFELMGREPEGGAWGDVVTAAHLPKAPHSD